MKKDAFLFKKRDYNLLEEVLDKTGIYHIVSNNKVILDVPYDKVINKVRKFTNDSLVFVIKTLTYRIQLLNNDQDNMFYIITEFRIDNDELEYINYLIKTNDNANDLLTMLEMIDIDVIAVKIGKHLVYYPSYFEKLESKVDKVVQNVESKPLKED